MPSYNGRCENCGHSEVIYKRMNDVFPNQCVSCGEFTFVQIYTSDVTIWGDCVSLGLQAERNAKSMGKELTGIKAGDIGPDAKNKKDKGAKPDFSKIDTTHYIKTGEKRSL